MYQLWPGGLRRGRTCAGGWLVGGESLCTPARMLSWWVRLSELVRTLEYARAQVISPVLRDVGRDARCSGVRCARAAHGVQA